MKTLSGSSDLPSLLSVKTKEERRFSNSSGRLSNEMLKHPSSVVEVYYGGAPVAVPFKWESQPGTPRVRFRESPLPPLTPPPSFLFHSPTTPSKKNSKPKGGILHAVLPKLTSTRKTQNSPRSSASSSESSYLFSPSSYSDSTSSFYTRHNHMESHRKSFEDQDRPKSPDSILCFRIRRRATPQRHVCNSGPF